jgi:ABC-type sugar transport system substrate-binding protein
VKQAGKTGKVHVIGLGLPSENRNYLKEGVTQDGHSVEDDGPGRG